MPYTKSSEETQRTFLFYRIADIIHFTLSQNREKKKVCVQNKNDVIMDAAVSDFILSLQKGYRL